MNHFVGEEMKSVIIYWSRYGNGKRIVEYLSEKLKEKKVEAQLFHTDEADPKALPEADVYVFSAPTEAFSIQRNMKSFMKDLEGHDGKKYGIINTHGMKKNWLGKMEKLLSKQNMIQVAAIDFRMDGDPKTGNALPSGWEKDMDSFAESLIKT